MKTHHPPLGGVCPTCGRTNAIVNQCRCDPNNLPTKVPTTVRFWEFINGAWVKLTLHASRPLRWRSYQPTDEGYHFEDMTWEYDYPDAVLRIWCNGGRDCDGGISHTGSDQCSVANLASVPAYEDEDGSHIHEGRRIHRPDWDAAEPVEVYDEFAQAMNY